MKKTLSIFIAFSLIIIIYQLGTSSDKNNVSLELNDNDWQTFEMDKQNKLSQHKTTKEEASAAKLPKKKSNRSPASVKTNDVRKPFLFPGQKMPKTISYKNEIKSDWKEKLAPSLMRFLTPKTKLFIRKEESLIIIERDQARYAEKVLLKFQTDSGRHYSYNALVDSETGSIIKTWNRIQHEGIGHKKLKMQIN